MLIINREPGESVFLQIGNGEEIEIKIRKTLGSKISLGIKAPEHVAINRFRASELDPEKLSNTRKFKKEP